MFIMVRAWSNPCDINVLVAMDQSASLRSALLLQKGYGLSLAGYMHIIRSLSKSDVTEDEKIKNLERLFGLYNYSLLSQDEKQRLRTDLIELEKYEMAIISAWLDLKFNVDVKISAASAVEITNFLIELEKDPSYPDKIIEPLYNKLKQMKNLFKPISSSYVDVPLNTAKMLLAYDQNPSYLYNIDFGVFIQKNINGYQAIPLNYGLTWGLESFLSPLAQYENHIHAPYLQWANQNLISWDDGGGDFIAALDVSFSVFSKQERSDDTNIIILVGDALSSVDTELEHESKEKTHVLALIVDDVFQRQYSIDNRNKQIMDKLIDEDSVCRAHILPEMILTERAQALNLAQSCLLKKVESIVLQQACNKV